MIVGADGDAGAFSNKEGKDYLAAGEGEDRGPELSPALMLSHEAARGRTESKGLYSRLTMGAELSR